MTLRALAFLLLLTSAASAQPVQQSGSVTPNHAAAWLTNGVIGDGGTAANPKFSSIGTVGQGPTICANSAPITQPYVRLCLAANTSSAAILSLENLGGATAQSLQFNINGTFYSFPYTVGGIVGPNSSTVGDIAVWNNVSGSLLKDVPPLQIFGTELANCVLAGPTSGGATFPTCRSLVAADLPLFSSSQNGAVSASGGGTANFLRADDSWQPVAVGPGSTISGDLVCWNNTTGTLLKDCGPPGAINTYSSSHALNSSDCNTTAIYTGTLTTITVPVGTTCAAGQRITVINDNLTRGQILTGAGLPADLVSAVNACGAGNNCLWQKQAFVIVSDGTNWKTVVNPGQKFGPIALFIDTSLGSDSGDCQAAGTGACLSATQMLNLACSAFEPPSGNAAVTIAGTLHSVIFGGCSTFRLLQISGTFTIDDGNTPGVALECDDSCQIQLGVTGSVTLSSLATNSTDLMGQRGGLVDVTNTTFITAAGTASAIIQSKDGSNINLNSGNTFAGGGGTTIGYFALVSRGGHIVTGAAQTVTGTWTVSQAGCFGASTGVVDATNGAFTGGTVTGNRANAATAGGVNAATSCPGNANTTATAPGWLN